MNFNKTSLGVAGELLEWSKVNYLESEEVGVDQEKSREETSMKKIHTHKMRGKNTQNNF